MLGRIIGVDADRAALQESLSALADMDYEIMVVADGAAALSLIEQQPPILVVASMSTADPSYTELLRHIKAYADVPIILIVTAVDVNGLLDVWGQYIDDFVANPVNPHELEARIRHLLRITPRWAHLPEQLIVIDERLRIDFGLNRIYVDEKTYRLTPTEGNLLQIFFSNAGQVVENETLMARLWPLRTMQPDALRVHIFRLRDKIERDPRNPEYLRTVHGIGYIFTVQPQPPSST